MKVSARLGGYGRRELRQLCVLRRAAV